MDIKIGSIISFRYKGGRFVKGEVTFVNQNAFTLILHTDYFGKNVDWYAGESKDFNRQECKKVTIWKLKTT